MKLKNSLVGIIVVLMLCLFTSCVPSPAKIYTVGDTYTITQNDGTIKCAIKLDSADYLINEDGQTCTLSLTYIIYPNITLELDSQNIFVSCEEKKYYTDEEINSEKNGSNIFDSIIDEEINYTFYFIIPNSPYFDNLENREEGYMGWEINCHIDEAGFEVYTGILYDKAQE